MRFKNRRLSVLGASIGILVLLSSLGLAPHSGNLNLAKVRRHHPPQEHLRPSETVPLADRSETFARLAEDIRQREYHLTWQDSPLTAGGSAGYQAPNRAHNLRIGFDATGVRIVPRVAAPTASQDTQGKSWAWGIALTGFGRGNPAKVGRQEVVPLAAVSETFARLIEANRVEYRREGITEWYVNGEDGLEQAVQITDHNSPIGNRTSPAVLEMALTGDLIPRLVEDGQAVELSTSDGHPTLHYGALSATDANGNPIPAQMALIPTQHATRNTHYALRITTDDTTAPHPITIRTTITALPSSADWIGEANRDSAHMGYALSTAGDVNGDGYADLLVGAPEYDGGLAHEGAAFVYLGSATGLGSSPAWSAEGDQADAHFGAAVSIAGDVDGDGYADVIIGAPDYDDGQADEGAAFVYYGSASGPTSGTADWTATGDQAGAHFGTAVSTAGDVDGDGYADVIVGAPDYDDGQTNEGAAFVYLGSGGGLTSGTADWTATGDQAGAHFGTAVSTAGDVDGDGYDDVIVGAPGYDDGQADMGAAFVYHGSGGGLTSGTADWTATGDQEDAHFGASVSTAGDVDGDGYADVIVGAPDRDGERPGEGAAFVYHGGASGLGTAPAWTVQPANQNNAHFGAAVSLAGDLNSDGYADVVIGAPDYNDGQTDEGAAYVYHGGPYGLSTLPAWSASPTDQDYAHFGIAVSTAGDVNGDGHGDLAIGATGYDHEHTDEGGAFVYHGSPGGMATTPAWHTAGKQEGVLLGWSVSTAGDVNGDGYADVIVGAPRYDNGQAEEGVAFVYTGGPDGPSTSPAWTGESDQAWAWFGAATGSAGDVNGDGYADVIVGAPRYDVTGTLAMIDVGRAFVYYGSATGLTTGAADWTVTGDQQDARLGAAVSTAGDVDGDGYADVVITANGYDAEESNEGAAFVYLGGATGLITATMWSAHPTDQPYANFGLSASTAGDVNGDGYSDVIIGAPWYDNPLVGQSDNRIFDGIVFVYHGSPTGLGQDPAWTVPGDFEDAQFGIAVSTAGDVNGDGYSDVIVGAFHYEGSAWHEGAALAYYGSSTGLTTGSADWTATGGQQSAKFGHAVSTAGDVNGDGYSDVVVGGYNYADGHSQEGVARVYHGGPEGLADSSAWSVQGDQQGAGYGYAVSTAGDVNGDGYSDIIVGAPTYNGAEMDEGGAFVYLGNGGAGVAVRPRQLRSDGSAPIAPLGVSDTPDQVGLAVTGRTPLGREAVGLQWQVAPLGTSFTAPGAISGISAGWRDMLTTGVTLSQTVAGLSGNTVYRWRVRLLYEPGNRLGQAGSRWLYLPWNGPQEADFRTPRVFAPDWGPRVYLPVMMR